MACIENDTEFAFGRVVWYCGLEEVRGIDLQTMRGLVYLACDCRRKIPAVNFVRSMFPRLSIGLAKQMIEDFAEYFGGN